MRVVHHIFAPHVDLRYALRAVLLFLQPWTYRHGASRKQLEAALSKQFSGDAVLFASGREALLALFQAMELRSGEEVIVQAYTCVVVPNAITAAGGVPVYVDIDPDTLNLDPDAVEKAITPHTRAVICQHTFGIPSDTATLRRICDKKKILLIEDCAHVLPDEKGPSEIGKLGDAMLLSFGRDKAISGVSGGGMIIRSETLATKLRERNTSAIEIPFSQVLRYLLYPLIYVLARPLYTSGIGKALLVLARRLRLLLPITDSTEKHGHMSPLLHRCPNACAALACRELQRLTHINNHRRSLVSFYLAEIDKRQWNILPGFQLPPAIRPDLPLQKFPLFFLRAQDIRKALKTKGIELNDGWTGCVICPSSVDISGLDYIWGQDPQAEAVCQQILSLPTHPTMTLQQAGRLMDILENELRIRNHES